MNSIAALILFAAPVTSSYNYVTSLRASTPTYSDGFGGDLSVAFDGTTLILAAGVISLQSNQETRHVEIFKSTDNGQTWLYSQSISSWPIILNPANYPFVTTFSENGKALMISTIDYENEVVSLFFDMNGQYVNSTLNLLCDNPSYYGASLALSGDGKWAFVFGGAGAAKVIFTNTQTGECQDLSLVPNFSPYSLASNRDGSTLVIGGTNSSTQGFSFLFFTSFSYQSTALPTFQLIVGSNYGGFSSSLTRDGSIFAVGMCGFYVDIYNVSDMTAPIQTLTLPPLLNPLPFGCSVTFSDDGMRLVVGSYETPLTVSDGLSYAYIRVGDVFYIDTIVYPPISYSTFGGYGLAVVNTPTNISIVLVGGPGSGIGQSGQIAVFNSAPNTFPTATPTATTTAITTITSTPNTFPTPSSPPVNSLASSSAIFAITSSISIVGGIIGSFLGFFIIRCFQKRLKSNKNGRISTFNSINNDTSKESLLELPSTEMVKGRMFVSS